ncbi:carboxymuconolactone decarboxylase family protein [Streptomyces corynorhini]|uniref:Carboxymuconolactone decarboxylase-like domain-containing protein n=1 Tax=Streptomyces corynorhini TaxID=2282652 RepID=A0A370BAM0_9ACTN|nr:carboxymuconolactone decarboxylase family protein [Streptomyces corynorhini]RDG36863.1 hypothetical protein DVH02_17755 [Streptomyces corynorhini]
MRPRIEPQAVDDFAATPGGQEYAQVMGGLHDGLLADRPPPYVVRTLANHPSLLSAILPLLSHVAGNVLPARERELVVLRTAWRCQAPYVWAHHHASGLLVGMSETELARVASDDAEGWEPFEALLLCAVDELHASSVLSDGTWKQLGDHYSEEQILELLALSGTYRTLGQILNSTLMPPDPWLEQPALLPADPRRSASARPVGGAGSRPRPRQHRGIVLQGGNGLSLLAPAQARTEPSLHEILVRFPGLLSAAASAHDAASRLLLIRRNPADVVPDADGCPFGATHLFADAQGVPTLVEVVEPHDVWNVRESLARILEYAGSGSRHWPMHILQRSLEHTARTAGVSVEQALKETGRTLDEETFLRTVESNLVTGRLRMVVVTSELPPEFSRMIDFLGRQLHPAEVYGVELRRYSDGMHAAFVPRVVG